MTAAFCRAGELVFRSITGVKLLMLLINCVPLYIKSLNTDLLLSCMDHLSASLYVFVMFLLFFIILYMKPGIFVICHTVGPNLD